MVSIAVIGAGISGLVLARELSHYAEVVVFEKARGVGGRMSTRYADPFYFDHGTQFFTARTPAFQEYLAHYLNRGIVAEWTGKVITLEAGAKETKRLWFEPHLVASPNMNSLCKALAQGMTIHTSCEVAPLQNIPGDSWELMDKDGKSLGAYDWVISTAPPVQTARLFKPYLAEDHPLRCVILQGCYALMLGYSAAWQRSWIAASVNESPLQWISVNSSKPGRDAGKTCLVIHSTNPWAEAHINDDMNEAQTFLLEEFTKVTGIDTATADYINLHRWRYATVDTPRAVGGLMDAQVKLAATGDWCGASRIEDVWIHATSLAEKIAAQIK